MQTRSKVLLATSMLAGLAAFTSGAAFAQTTTSASKTDDKSCEATKTCDTTTEVTVVGSRIRNKEFTSSSPVQIITSERNTLLGATDPTKILQGSTTANTASQINNEFTGFVVTGGPGVNTISLRGLGAQRTLVLLNGHRAGPAGVRGQVSAADLNTIPNSIVDQYQILKDGASSIYGSDAIAGVINIVTKQNYTGGDAKLVVSQPQREGGETTQFSITQGFLKDRFHGAVSFDYYEQKSLLQSQRKYMTCPSDYVFDPTTGARMDIVDTTPGSTGGYRCNILLGSRVDVLSGTLSGRTYVYDSTAVNGGGPQGDYLNGLRRVGANYNGSAPTAATIAATRFSAGQSPVNNPKYLNRTILSPVRRESANFFGGYDLNDNMEVYTELMFNERFSNQRSWRQIFPTVNITNPNNPFRTGNPGGYAAGSARSIVTVPSVNDQKVVYTRALVGLKGALPGWYGEHNWTYDLALQSSSSVGDYGGNFYYNDRVNATTAAGTVCNTALMTIAPTACPTGGVQWFRQSTVDSGNFSDEEKAFLMGYEWGKTKYIQQYFEGNFAGDLFELPAGTVSAAWGFDFRRERINDNPGTQAKLNNYWGSTTAGQTQGSDTVREIYGEIDVPVLKNVYMAKKLDLSFSSRSSDYASYGQNSTYKFGVNWAINNDWRIRASQGTSFRAPALYELYLANQSGFLSQSSIDPCYNLGAAASPAPTVVTNCAAQGIPTNYTAAGQGSALVTAGGGKGILSAETGLSKTVGIIYTPSWSKLSIDVDYFETTINNEVAQYGAANILYSCYNSPNLSSPFCSLFQRDLTSSGTAKYQILSVQNNYVNISKQYQRGIDLTISYAHDFKFAKFQFDNHNSFLTAWTTTQFPNSAPSPNLGFVGYPRYVGDANFRFDRKDWTLTWNVQMVGHSSDLFWFGTDLNTNYSGQTVALKRYAEFYADHTVSLRKKFDKWTVIGVVQNLFDEQPPNVSTGALAAVNRLGTVPLTSQYDLMGRTFSLTLQRKW